MRRVALSLNKTRTRKMKSKKSVSSYHTKTVVSLSSLFVSLKESSSEEEEVEAVNG